MWHTLTTRDPLTVVMFTSGRWHYIDNTYDNGGDSSDGAGGCELLALLCSIGLDVRQFPSELGAAQYARPTMCYTAACSLHSIDC